MQIRGIEVTDDSLTKTLRLTINKPKKNTFSLSDQIIKKINGGYTALVTIGETTYQITKDDKPFLEETVSSKFPNYPPWHRYWYYTKTLKEDKNAKSD